jgi:hypothetical protein
VARGTYMSPRESYMLNRYPKRYRNGKKPGCAYEVSQFDDKTSFEPHIIHNHV